MTKYCGVFRTQELLPQGLKKVQELKQEYEQIYLDDQGKVWNTELRKAIELKTLMIVSEIILTSVR